MEYRIYKVATLADHCFDKDLPISESMVLRKGRLTLQAYTFFLL